MRHLKHELNAHDYVFKESRGFSGGLVLGWSSAIKLDERYISHHCIETFVHEIKTGNRFLLFCCYWLSKKWLELREMDNFISLLRSYPGQCLVMGALNVINSEDEK